MIAPPPFFDTDILLYSISSVAAEASKRARALTLLDGDDGALSVQSEAVPRVSVEAAHAVRDIYANVMEPSTGAPIEVRVTRDGESYVTLTIPPGETLRWCRHPSTRQSASAHGHRDDRAKRHAADKVDGEGSNRKQRSR